MNNKDYILAIDQGTSGSKAVVFDAKGTIISKGFSELSSYFPQAGFVEQKPEEIYQSVIEAVKSCVKNNHEIINSIVTCGISNQRETFLLWDKSGNPLCNAVVWQCKRSIDICNRLKSSGIEKEINDRTGLIIDPYFSGTKLVWLYENDSRIKKAIDSGNAYFGTVDTWLLYKLTKGAQYCTDFTNASRTLFFNIFDLKWDNRLLELFNLKNVNLPQVKASADLFGATDFDGVLPNAINICSMIGDSHAAAFGEGCFESGIAKATLGTGSSILMNIGDKKINSEHGMVTTICWSTKERVDYALEGIIVSCGSTITWLQNQLNLFQTASESDKMALSVPDNNGVYLIPAFSGLGAPHWKMDAKASIHGLTFDCNKNHIVRAALESIPYQIKDVISSMEKDSGTPLNELKVDGGITVSDFIMQFLSDLLSVTITNIGIKDVSALGAAYLAGYEYGFYQSIDEIKMLNQNKKETTPDKSNLKIAMYHEKWKEIVQEL
jgi:glycerol kinase